MIPTLRRGRDDVFLIGEEEILLARDADRDPDPTIAIEGLGGHPSRRPRSHRLPASLRGARGLVPAGLAAGTAALLLALRPGGGEGPARVHPTSPPRSPLISRSAAGVPAGRTSRVHHPVSQPAEVPHRSVVHHQRSHRPEAPPPPRPEVTRGEPEREPTPQVAPVSSLAVTARAEAVPEPGPGPAATSTPTPPVPSPPSSGGGPGGVEDPPSAQDPGPADVESFGFER